MPDVGTEGALNLRCFEDECKLLISVKTIQVLSSTSGKSCLLLSRK